MTEVAHDFNSQVRKIVEESGMKNSFDTWHGTYTSVVSGCHGDAIPLLFTVGTKRVARALAKIASGPLKDKERKWFSQLSDKSNYQLIFWM